MKSLKFNSIGDINYIYIFLFCIMVPCLVFAHDGGASQQASFMLKILVFGEIIRLVAIVKYILTHTPIHDNKYRIFAFFLSAYCIGAAYPYLILLLLSDLPLGGLILLSYISSWFFGPILANSFLRFFSYSPFAQNR